MNHYPFVYQATVFWYEDGETHHYRIAGVGFCDSYTDAVQQIEEREKEYLESIEYLELFDESSGDSIIEIPSAWVPIISKPADHGFFLEKIEGKNNAD